MNTFHKELMSIADTVDMTAFMSLPIHPPELSVAQVEQLASIAPNVIDRLAHQTALEAPPSVREVNERKYRYMTAMPADVDDHTHRQILAAYDADLDRWLVLTPEAVKRYLVDPGCIPELDVEDILSAHNDTEQARTALLRLAGPSVLERVERTAHKYAQSACLAAVVAMSLALWSKRTRGSLDEIDNMVDADQQAYEAHMAQLRNPS